MPLSPDVKIPICIERGSVFNFYIDFKDSERESKNRYFVVINRNPKEDVVLLMLTPTTKINKAKEFVQRNQISAKTVVEIKAREYGSFTRDCVFNCNNVLEMCDIECLTFTNIYALKISPPDCLMRPLRSIREMTELALSGLVFCFLNNVVLSHYESDKKKQRN